jgi:hypothetical protein
VIKERFASILLYISTNKILRKILLKYYSVGLKSIHKDLENISEVETLYLKGSINTTDFEPGVSDLDFIVISTNSIDKSLIKKIFRSKSRFFPFIKDYDLYSKEEFSYLTSFGGVKFLNNSKWKLLFGKELRVKQYVYFPYKFLADQLSELYFLLVWLSENLEKLNNIPSLYRKKNIARTVKKIVIIVKWIENPLSFEKPLLNNLSSIEVDLVNSILLNKTGLGIAIDVYKYLSSKVVFDQIYSFLPFDYDWLEENFEIIDNNYYKKYISGSSHNFVVPKNKSMEFNIDLNDILLPESLFQLFHKLGCIEKEVLLLNASSNSTNLIGLFSLAQFYGQSDSDQGIPDQLPSKNELQKNILDRYELSFSKPINFLNKTTFVSVSWGFQRERYIAMLKAKKKLSSQNGSFEFLHVFLDIKNQLTQTYMQFMDSNVLTIKGDLENSNLWHKEALYNLSALFCFSSKNFIFADADVYSDNSKWLLGIESLLDDGYDFVHGFSNVVDTIDSNYRFDSWTKKYLEGETSHVAPGLVWGIKNSTLKEIEFLPDSLPDGSCDGAFIQEMTGTEMGFVNNFKWYRSKIRKHSRKFKVTYVPVEVTHINHGVSRDYDNRGVLLDLVNFNFLDVYRKDSFGVYKWTTNDPKMKSALLLKNLYYKLKPERFLALIDELIALNYLEVPSTFNFIAEDNINNVLSTTDGISILYKYKNDGSYRILTSAKNSKNSKIRLRFGGTFMMDNEYIHYKFEIFNNGDFFKGSINYNWWTLFGSNDLNYKFFKNSVKQTIELVPSSWENNIPLFVDLDVTKASPGNQYYVNKTQQEHVSMYHAWDGIDEFVVTKDEIETQSNSALIELRRNVTTKNGWFRVEYFFDDTKDQGIKVSIVAGSKSVPITATRKLENCNVPFKRIIFYKNHYTSDIKLFLKFIDSKNVDFGSLRVVIYTRRILK